jgi:PAS domain S-box-containing protein
MKGEDKTKEQLSGELVELRRRVAELEVLETERKRAEEELRASEQRYRLLLESISDSVYVLDREWRHIVVNDAAGRFVRIPKEKLLGGKLTDLFPGVEETEFFRTFQRVMETRQPDTVTGEYTFEDGRKGWYEVHVYPVPEGILCISRDITGRKILEEIWKRYNFIVNTSGDFMTLIDRDYAYEAVNESYCRALNKTQEEVVGHNAADVWGEERFLTQIKEHLDKCFAGNEVHFQGWFEFAALGRRCFDVVYYPYYDSGGTATHVVVVSRDITEHKRAEEALELRVEQLAALSRTSQVVTASLELDRVLAEVVSLTGKVVTSDYTGVVLVDEAVRMGQSAENLPGVPAIEYRVRDEGITNWIVRSRQAVVVDEIGEDGVTTPDLGEGAPRTANPLVVETGVKSLAGLPLVVKDRLLGVLYLYSLSPGAFRGQLPLLTAFANQAAIAIENARLFGQVRAGRERLQNLSQRLVEVQETERRRIARELHDEIGQALTALKIDLQTMQRSPAALPLAPYLEETVGIVERTLQQVRNLSLDLRPSLLDDLGLVPALRWCVDRQAQRAGINVQFAAEPLEKRLPADVETTCFRVVQEALTNVVRHAQARQVSIELQRRDEDLLVAIRDDGVGFDVQRALQRATRGESLGLPGMQERVLLAGGQIEIESAPAHGTEVRIRLPMNKA